MWQRPGVQKARYRASGHVSGSAGFERQHRTVRAASTDLLAQLLTDAWEGKAPKRLLAERVRT